MLALWQQRTPTAGALTRSHTCLRLRCWDVPPHAAWLWATPTRFALSPLFPFHAPNFAICGLRMMAWRLKRSSSKARLKPQCEGAAKVQQRQTHLVAFAGPSAAWHLSCRCRLVIEILLWATTDRTVRVEGVGLESEGWMVFPDIVIQCLLHSVLKIYFQPTCGGLEV